jgi:hypothetical protein
MSPRGAYRPSGGKRRRSHEEELHGWGDIEIVEWKFSLACIFKRTHCIFDAHVFKRVFVMVKSFANHQKLRIFFGNFYLLKP